MRRPRLLFVVQRHYKTHVQGKIGRGKMMRNIALEILALFAIILFAGIASRHLGAYAGASVESHWPGLGAIAGLAAAILVSFGVGFGIRRGVSKMVKS